MCAACCGAVTPCFTGGGIRPGGRLFHNNPWAYVEMDLQAGQICGEREPAADSGIAVPDDGSETGCTRISKTIWQCRWPCSSGG